MNEYTNNSRATGTHTPNEPGAGLAPDGRLETRALSPDGASPRLLAIGDSETADRVRQVLEGTLHAHLDTAADEQTALALMARRPYDLILLLAPPAGDAAAACRRLRAANQQVPLLVLATAGGEGDLIATLAAGADRYLERSVKDVELRAHCAALLRSYGSVAATDVPVAAVPTTVAPPVARVPPALPTPASHRFRGIGGVLSWLRRRGGHTGMAAALVLAGALGTHALETNQTPTAVAASASTTAALTTVTAASIDAATEQAFAVAGPSVVYVENVGVGSGSGVIYDSTGDIVTNAHVVAGATTIRVTLASGKTYTAKLVGTDTADDLAVIHISTTGLPAAHFAAVGTYKVAQEVLAIGSPLGLQESVTSGLISALGRTVQEENGAYLPNAVQTSAPINPGNSGGALVTLDGTVVGIPTLEASDPQNNNGGAAQGIGFAVSSSRVTYIAKQLIATGTVAHTGRAYLGVSAADAATAQAQSPYFGGGFGGGNGGGATPATVQGALVEQVAAGSPADQAGLQQGDVITAVNSKTINGSDDLLSALANAKPGQTLTLTVNRGGTTLTVHATLGELPAS